MRALIAPLILFPAPGGCSSPLTVRRASSSQEQGGHQPRDCVLAQAPARLNNLASASPTGGDGPARDRGCATQGPKPTLTDPTARRHAPPNSSARSLCAASLTRACPNPAADEPGTGWSSLPDPLLERILSSLKLDDRVRASAACSAWLACSRRRRHAWAEIRVGDIPPVRRDRFRDEHLLALCGRAGGALAALDVSGGLLRHHAAWTADGALRALGGALALGAPLRALNVARAPVGDAGARLAAEAMLRGRLDTLSLRSTGIGDAGLDAVCCALERPGCALCTLDVGWNKLRAAGAERLGLALAQNRSLTALHAPGNEFNDSAAAGLARALAAPGTALALLDLESNAVGAAGCAALAAALCAGAGNAALTSLNLRDNCAGSGGAEALAAAIREGRARAPPLPLRSLDVVGCGIGGVGAMALNDAAAGDPDLLSGMQLGSVLARGGALGSGRAPLMACLEQEIGCGSREPVGHVSWPRQSLRPAPVPDALAVGRSPCAGGALL